ncbi:MAG: metalloregulator ArsR/SmtB family transcription factor [Actinomycetota bacterium]|nr:metalloregulator ArsR/SmtB family transcription factor [Actinomycetota bacterium]
MTDELSRAFGALGDPTRRDMLVRLASGDATVTSLAERYDLSMQAVSKHVKVLEAAGLVTKTHDGQRRHVHLEPAVLDLMAGWIRRYQREAEARYRRLDDVLAQMSGAAAEEEIA